MCVRVAENSRMVIDAFRRTSTDAQHIDATYAIQPKMPSMVMASWLAVN